MNSTFYDFHNVSLLVTHYNRSRSLERLLASFTAINCSFGEVIVSDDGSKPEHLKHLNELQQQFDFKLITTPENKGLGNNINKGQDAVTLPYTLYIQEDFEPSTAFPECFRRSLEMLRERPDLDIIRYYAYFDYPYVKMYKNNFAEMKFHAGPWYQNHLKFYVYSDHPHLRRSNFLQKFGRYPEGIKGDETEYRMAVSFIKNHGKGLLYKDYTKIFYQKNSSAEPSTMQRSNWRQSRNVFILLTRAMYLKVKLLKCTLDLALMKMEH